MATAVQVLLKSSNLYSLGWTPKLVKLLLGEPDEKEDISRGIYRCTRHWWLQDRVQAAMLLPAYLEAQQRKERRSKALERRVGVFERKYWTWRSALSDACHGLHSLNRYTKHDTCSSANKTEIYDLKNQIVELLYREGYCSACWQHVLVLPAKPCWDCGGNPVDEWCDKCGGSGVYLTEKRIKFYCFRFDIGRGYTWHQPDKSVTFQVTTTAPPADWSGVEREKPLGIPQNRLGEFKHLIRWVIEQSKLPHSDKEIAFSDEPIPAMADLEQADLFA